MMISIKRIKSRIHLFHTEEERFFSWKSREKVSHCIRRYFFPVVLPARTLYEIHSSGRLSISCPRASIRSQRSKSSTYNQSWLYHEASLRICVFARILVWISWFLSQKASFTFFSPYAWCIDHPVYFPVSSIIFHHVQTTHRRGFFENISICFVSFDLSVQISSSSIRAIYSQRAREIHRFKVHTSFKFFSFLTITILLSFFWYSRTISGVESVDASSRIINSKFW